MLPMTHNTEWAATVCPSHPGNYYPHTPIGKVWIYCLLFVCFLFLCVFVRLWISLPRIKIVASNFAQRFIGVQGRESHILGNFAPPKAQNRMNRAWSTCWPIRLIEMRRLCNIVWRWLRTDRCGYTAVPEDGRTCLKLGHLQPWSLWLTNKKHGLANTPVHNGF